MDEEDERVEVVVPDEQLSLAIGRRGQNVRLASPADRLADRHHDREPGERAPPARVRRAHRPVPGSPGRRRGHRPAAGHRRLRHGRGRGLRRRLARSPPSRASTRTPPRSCRPAPATSWTRKPPSTTPSARELGVEDGVLEIEGVTLPMAVALGEGDVKTVEDLAGLVPDDLRGWFESKDGERVREPGVLESFNLDAGGRRGADHARPRRHGLDRGPSRSPSRSRKPRTRSPRRRRRRREPATRPTPTPRPAKS